MVLAKLVKTSTRISLVIGRDVGSFRKREKRKQMILLITSFLTIEYPSLQLRVAISMIY